MKRPKLVAPLLAIMIAVTAAATQSSGQILSDAQQALQKARKAYDSGSFGEARDLAKKAAETDSKNADVYLLLGKAHYQLGELDDAMAAWNQTLVLAPKESFARQMLEMLQSRRKDVDSRIRYVESLIADRLDAVAAVECHSLLEGNKSLSDGQRAAILTLQAKLAIHGGRPAEALQVLESVQALYPKQADSTTIKLITGQAKLQLGGPIAAEGLAILKELATRGDTPAAAMAQYELIYLDLSQGVDRARIAALAKWLADHPKHSQTAEARSQLLTAYLTLANQAAPPRPDASLGESDGAALAVAKEIIKLSPRSDEKAAVVQRMVEHLSTKYASRMAYSAVIVGLRDLLPEGLPRPSRIAVRLALYAQLKALALEHLRVEAQSGRLSRRRSRHATQTAGRRGQRPGSGA